MIDRVIRLALALALVACDQPSEQVVRTVLVPPEALGRVPIDVTFSDVREIAVAEQAIWVLDRVPPFVTRITRGVEPTAGQFGREGDGPAELRQPVALAPTDDGVYVWDAQLGKGVSYGPDGAVANIERLSEDRSGWIRSDMAQVSHLDPWRIRQVGGFAMYVRLPNGMTRPIDYGSGSLVLSASDLGSTAHVVEHAMMLPRDDRAGGQFPAMPLWDAGPDGFVVWNPRLGQVEWRKLSGVVRHTQPVPSEGVKITTAGIEHFLRRMAGLELGPGAAQAEELDLRARAKEVAGAFGSVGTPFVDLRLADDGRAWLRRFDLEVDPLGASSTWLLVGPGTSAIAFHFPPHFEPYAFADGLVIGVTRTEWNQSLTVWRTTVDRSTP